MGRASGSKEEVEHGTFRGEEAEVATGAGLAAGVGWSRVEALGGWGWGEEEPLVRLLLRY